MPPVAQGAFARLARGGPADIGPPNVERIVLMLSSQARAAAKHVHSMGVVPARAELEAKMDQHTGTPAEASAQSYLDSFETYVAWDGTARPAEKGVQPVIPFLPEGSIRARADIIFDLGSGQFAGRLLLWDELPLSRAAAEVIALPSIQAVENRYGTGAVPYLDVWQLATGQREQVDAATAAVRDPDVRAILGQI